MGKGAMTFGRREGTGERNVSSRDQGTYSVREKEKGGGHMYICTVLIHTYKWVRQAPM